MKSATLLTQQVLQLTPKRRARLAHVLIQSLDTTTDADAERQWDAEIARRVADIRHGRVQGVPAEKVLARRPRHKS